MNPYYTITVYPQALVVKRTENSKPIVLFCPFKNEGPCLESPIEGQGYIGGACAPDCPHFGNPERTRDGFTRIRLTCGHAAVLETTNFRWVEEKK